LNGFTSLCATEPAASARNTSTAASGRDLRARSRPLPPRNWATLAVVHIEVALLSISSAQGSWAMPAKVTPGHWSFF